MAWTDERVEVLKKLWAEGLSASQIAKELGGVTRNAVIGKVHRLGLSGRATPSRPPQRVASVRPRQPSRKVKAPAAGPEDRAPRVASGAAAEPAAPRPVVKRVVTPLEPAPQTNGEFASVLNLSDHTCNWPIGDKQCLVWIFFPFKWPIGDPGSPEFRFCGRKSKPGSPYCEAHAQQAYHPTKKRRRGGESVENALDAIASARRGGW